jgi:hypothetical protein
VLFARLEEDHVAGADHLDRPAVALTEPDAVYNPDRLTARMGVCQAVRAPGVK